MHRELGVGAYFASAGHKLLVGHEVILGEHG